MRLNWIFLVFIFSLFSYLPAQVKNDFQVTDVSEKFSPRQPRIAIGIDGSFVIVWADYRMGKNINGSYQPDIFAQRYNSNGIPQDNNSRVNSDDGAVSQSDPDICVDRFGNTTIVWSSSRNGNDDIYCQYYDATGKKIGENFRVNDDDGFYDQDMSAIAYDQFGRFVVAWQDARNGKEDIFAQRFNPDGVPIDSNFRVNDYIGSAGGEPGIGMSLSGDFIITWTDVRYESTAVFCQKYDRSGEPVDMNFKASDDLMSLAPDKNMKPRIAMDDKGNCVVAWLDYRHHCSNPDIFCKIYKCGGNSHNNSFKINDTPLGRRSTFALAMDKDNFFIVAWEDERNGDPDIYAQLYDKKGHPIGNNYRVNSDSSGSNQTNPDVKLMNGFVYYTWIDDRPGESHVFARIDYFPITDIATERAAADNPTGFAIGVNFPNPFNPCTTIPISLPVPTKVEIMIYDILGQPVKNLFSGELPAGEHYFTWNAHSEVGWNVTSGIYFCCLQTSSGIRLNRKMILLK
jgi:hypothetical protein